MATPLTDAINALTTYANETTGASDTNLSAAVGSLVAGYGGGGGGLTTIASGTFTGGDAYGVTLSIGNKMAQTDFFIKVTAQSNSEFPKDTYYKFAAAGYIVFSGIAHYDLSTNGVEKNYISDISYDENDNGTKTSRPVGTFFSSGSFVRSGSVYSYFINQLRITKNSSGFSLYLGNSNAVYKWPSTVTYNYEVLYFGSNPSTDIVQI